MKTAQAAKAPVIFLLIALLGTAWGAGKSADDYLHGGSAKYILGRHQEAAVEVDEGLRKYPGDTRLRALADQLKKMQDQKKQDQSGGGSGGQDQKDKQDKKDSSGQGSQNKDQDQKKQDKDKDKGKDKKDQDQKKDQDKQNQDKQNQQDQAKQDKDKGDSSGQSPAQAKPGQMSKDEAERLLNSYQDDEKREHQQMQHKQRSPVEVEKDW